MKLQDNFSPVEHKQKCLGKGKHSGSGKYLHIYTSCAGSAIHVIIGSGSFGVGGGAECVDQIHWSRRVRMSIQGHLPFSRTVESSVVHASGSFEQRLEVRTLAVVVGLLIKSEATRIIQGSAELIGKAES
jgi:hypothetical protein